MGMQERLGLSELYPLIPFRVRRDFPRPDPQLVSQFEKFYIPDISDRVGRMYTMDGTIRPLYQPTPRLVGPAFTVKCPPGDNAAVKIALHMVQPGDVLVIDSQGFTEWCCGGFGMLQLPIRQRRLKGLVVNGAYSDYLQAKASGFPIYAKGVAIRSGPKNGPGEINVAVCCGSVIVHPGDLMVADEDGVVVVPQEYIQAVADSLATARLRPKPEDWDDEYLAASDARWRNYLDGIFRDGNGVYLD